MDMVYRPRKTELLQLARRKGIETISGLEMFLAQGFAQYEIWTGERAPESGHAASGDFGAGRGRKIQRPPPVMGCAGTLPRKLYDPA